MPSIECIERSHDVNIINQDTTISTSVKRNSKTLKPFLASSVPYLPHVRKWKSEINKITQHNQTWNYAINDKQKIEIPLKYKTHLKSDEPVINLEFFGHKIRPYCRFVLLTKPLMNVSNISVNEPQQPIPRENKNKIKNTQLTKKTENAGKLI